MDCDLRSVQRLQPAVVQGQRAGPTASGNVAPISKKKKLLLLDFTGIVRTIRRRACRTCAIGTVCHDYLSSNIGPAEKVRSKLTKRSAKRIAVQLTSCTSISCSVITLSIVTQRELNDHSFSILINVDILFSLKSPNKVFLKAHWLAETSK